MLSIRSPDLIDTPVSKKSGLRSVRRQEAAMISVTVATDDTWVTCETDSGYSPDVLDDLSTHATVALMAAVAHLAQP